MGHLLDDLIRGRSAKEWPLPRKITLRTTVLKRQKPIVMTPEEIKSIREKLRLSQAVFAHKLRTSIRTYQGWEQGKTKPNSQAVLLLKMVEKSPKIFEKIARL